MSQLHPHYPSDSDIDQWSKDLRQRSGEGTLVAEPIAWEAPKTPTPRHIGSARYVRFERQTETPFYGFWLPAPSHHPCPLLVHLPGYGGEMSSLPELAAQGYHVLHVNPRGCTTPNGMDESRKLGFATWPQLPLTVRTLGREGYVDWFADAVTAVEWALARPEVDNRRFGFLGTSQGGGAALLLASVFRDRGVGAVAADVPFLCDFPSAWRRKRHGAAAMAVTEMRLLERDHPEQLPAAWNALGQVDVCCHAHRLDLPVLLTAGSDDHTCPAETVRALFERLPGTRSYTELHGQGHAYTLPFLHLAAAWFRLYV